MMKTYDFLALGAFSSLFACVPAHADTDLMGKWVGQFNGLQIEVPTERGPFGAPREQPKGPQAPRIVENTLQLDIETQSKGLAEGVWTSGQFTKHFVCALTGQTVWNCIDSGGRASVEVTSPSEIKVCYFDNREGAQGAGCAVLHRPK
jgi:hypothetical protein